MQAELPQDIQQMMQFMQDMDNIIQQQNDLLDKSRLQLDYQSHIDALQRRQDLQSNKEDNTSADKAEEDSFSNLDNLFKSLDMPAPDIHNNQGQSSTATQDTQSQNTPKSTMDVIMESGTQRHIQDQLHKMIDNMPMVPDELKEADKHMNQEQMLVLISTVLPGTTTKHFAPLVNNATFVYNPYLIAMGTVKQDFIKPEMKV